MRWAPGELWIKIEPVSAIAISRRPHGAKPMSATWQSLKGVAATRSSLNVGVVFLATVDTFKVSLGTMKAPLHGDFTLSSLASTPNASRCSAPRKSVFVGYRFKGRP